MSGPALYGLGAGLSSLGQDLTHAKDEQEKRDFALKQLTAAAAVKNQWKPLAYEMDLGDGQGRGAAEFNEQTGQYRRPLIPKAPGTLPHGPSDPGPIPVPAGGDASGLAMAHLTGQQAPSQALKSVPTPPPISASLPGNPQAQATGPDSAMQQLTGGPVAPAVPRPVAPPAVAAPSVAPVSTVARISPKQFAPQRIDPNSQAGISADSAKNANRALTRTDPLARKTSKPFMVDGTPTVLLQDGHGVLATVAGEPVTGKVTPYVPPSGGGLGGGGFGAGGIGGAGRTIAAINGLHQANDQMTPYEESVRNKGASFDGLDYFKTQMGRMYDAKGIVDPAIHSAVMAQLGAQNPALANYLQNGEMWALEESSIPGSRPSDFRTKLDAFVSSLKPNASDQMINSVQRGRTTRLEGYDQSVPALKASLARVAGTPVQPGNAPSSSTKRTPQQAWDEAVKLYGEARVLKEFGPRPPE